MKIFAALSILSLWMLACFGQTTPGNLSFTNTVLPLPNGGSEPEISIAANGTMGIIGLNWYLPWGVSLWTGPFGSTPTYRGLLDGALQQSGRRIWPGADGDIDMGTTGTLH